MDCSFAITAMFAVALILSTCFWEPNAITCKMRPGREGRQVETEMDLGCIQKRYGAGMNTIRDCIQNVWHAETNTGHVFIPNGSPAITGMVQKRIQKQYCVGNRWQALN